MKKTLREVIEKYNLSVRLTPNQNIILCDIRNAWKRPSRYQYDFVPKNFLFCENSVRIESTCHRSRNLLFTCCIEIECHLYYVQ